MAMITNYTEYITSSQSLDNVTVKLKQPIYNPSLVELAFHNKPSRASGVLLACVCCADVLINLAVLVVIIAVKTMHTRTNYYVVSLNISNLILPFYLIYYGLEGYWRETGESDLRCKGETYVTYLVGLSISYTLIAMAIDRYRSIVTPHKTKQTKKQTLGIIIGIWVAIIIIGLVPASAYREHPLIISYEPFFSHNLTICGLYYEYGYFTDMILVYVIPVVVQIVLYTCIIKVLRKPSLAISSSSANTKAKAVKMMITLLISFILLWTPFFIWSSIFFWTYFYHKSDHMPIKTFIELVELAKILPWLLLNPALFSFINALIYIGFSRNFRQAFVQLAKCKFRANSIGPASVGTDRNTGPTT